VATRKDTYLCARL